MHGVNHARSDHSAAARAAAAAACKQKQTVFRHHLSVDCDSAHSRLKSMDLLITSYG
jgi:hypothetical protein